MHANAQSTYSDEPETLIIRRFTNIPAKPTEYLWNPLIPRGKITLLAADPGSGKTTLALTLAAHLSRAEPLPTLCPPSPSSPGTESPGLSPLATLLLSPEDDPPDTLHPRLLAANANLEHIHFLENLHSLIPQKPRATDHEPRITPVEKLRQVCDDIPNLALLVIDPITHYLGLSDRLAPPSPDDPNSPRSILHQLAQLARQKNIAILLTTRLTKRIDPTLPQTSLQKILGPLSFPATARSVLLLSPLPHSLPPSTHLTPGDSPGACATCTPKQTAHPEKFLDQNKSPAIRSLDPFADSPTHLLIPLKLSTAALPTPLPYTLTNKISFHPSAPLPTAPAKNPGPAALSLDAAIDFLQQLLADGPVAATQILDQARDNALSKATLTRARILLHIRPRKQDYSGHWFWSLPADPRPLPENRFERQLADALKNFATPQLSPIEQLLKDADGLLDDLPEDDDINEPEEPTLKPPKKKRPAAQKGGKQLEHLGEIRPKTPPPPTDLEHLGHRSPSVSEGPSPSRTPATPPAHAASQPLPHLTPGDSPGAQCAPPSPETAHPEQPPDQHKSPAIRSLGPLPIPEPLTPIPNNKEATP